MDNSTTFQRMRWFAIGCGLVGSCMQMPGAYGQGTNQQLAPTQQSGLQGSGGQASVLVRYASTNKTPVYCGPGDDFYVTSQLRVGTAVEVFHQTKTGWCAVRPPDGSFGWLAAENAYLLPGGTVAEIVGTKVPAWIGSNLETPKQFRWQVELQPSQQVQVLGESKQKIDPDTERLWYRIAPPQVNFAGSKRVHCRNERRLPIPTILRWKQLHRYWPMRQSRGTWVSSPRASESLRRILKRMPRSPTLNHRNR